VREERWPGFWINGCGGGEVDFRALSPMKSPAGNLVQQGTQRARMYLFSLIARKREVIIPGKCGTGPE